MLSDGWRILILIVLHDNLDETNSNYHNKDTKSKQFYNTTNIKINNKKEQKLNSIPDEGHKRLPLANF